MTDSSVQPRFAAVIQHVPHEGLGAIEANLAQAGIRHRYFDPGRIGEIGSYDFLIVLGGPASVYDEYPGSHEEIGLIKSAIAAGKPVLGICLGSQLIAAALGSEVKPCGPKEIGWYPLDITAAGQNDPLFKHLEPRETVFQWHGDTFDIPGGAVRLASSPLCPNQAFRYGDCVYALQFHLEVAAPMVESWLAVPENVTEVETVLGGGGFERIRQDTVSHGARLGEIGEQTFSAFCRL